MTWIAVGLCLLNAVLSFTKSANYKNKPNAYASITAGVLWLSLAGVALLISK